MTADDFWGEPISVYTREQAIADGVLVDVTALAKESGFRIPVAFTAALWATCERGAPDHDAVRARAHDVLWLAFLRVRAALRKGETEGPFVFSVAIGGTSHRLWVAFNAAEGFTIGFPEDF